ncbi:MAG: GspE/PulE family protein, partial [Actinomycetota bacterium]
MSARQVDDAVERAAPGERLGATLRRLGLITEPDLADALATQLRLPRIDLDHEHVDLAAVAQLPEQLAERYDVLPLSLDGTTLTIAMTDPSDVEALDGVRLAAGVRSVRPVVATAAPLASARRRAYRAATTRDLVRELSSGTRAAPAASTAASVVADSTPVGQLAEALVADALAARASDVHLEPDRDGARVRLRVDGELRETAHIPEDRAAPLRSRLKLLAELDIAERRLPQDGRALIRVGSREQDLRLSVMPTLHGETLVLRLLPRYGDLLGLDGLGLATDDLARLTSTLARPQGLILLTGPTGSGKTTTAYASLAAVDPHRRNILTLEDPIEVEFPGVNQTQVDAGIGLSFAHGLRHVLRQDPDVLLVGEVRDRETAALTVEAASTGHLVIATLHTNDAPSAVARLADLGADRFLLASALQLVVAQRLVQQVCERCAADDPDALEALTGLSGDALIGATPRRGRGCEHCDGHGVHGRSAIAETLPVTPRLRQQLQHGVDELRVAQTATELGWRPLRFDAIDRALAGRITVEEALRTTPKP